MITLKIAKNLPNTPGIYRFLSDKKPLYIGKSKNIKARVNAHIKSAALSKKEAKIVQSSDSVDFFKTVSDFDAIILEAKLIKKFKPKYNSALKDDKHFL